MEGTQPSQLGTVETPPPQAIPGQTPLSTGPIVQRHDPQPNLFFTKDCWTFLAQISFSELLRIGSGACPPLGGRGAGPQPQRVLQPLQRLLLRLHQGEGEGEIVRFIFQKKVKGVKIFSREQALETDLLLRHTILCTHRNTF